MRVLFVLLLVGSTPAVDADLTITSGVVRNTVDNQPVPDAVVEAECRRSKLHGSYLVKTLTTATDARGAFKFAKWSLITCDYITVNVKKAGFVETASGPQPKRKESEKRLTIFYVTPLEALTMHRLKILELMTHGKSTRFSSGEPAPEVDYQRVFTGFHCSRYIAETREELGYIRDNYCDRLKTMEASLSDMDRARLPSLPPQLCDIEGPAKANPDEVRSFCDSSPADDGLRPTPATVRKARLNQESLNKAVCERDLASIRRLATAGVDMNTPATGCRGLRLPLQVAMALSAEIRTGIRDRDFEAFDLLIRLGANVNARGSEGETLLEESLEKPDVELVNRLVDAGARTDIPGKSGKTAGQFARAKYGSFPYSFSEKARSALGLPPPKHSYHGRVPGPVGRCLSCPVGSE